ncbi:SET domain-containing protein-lysine N-methyltransferase [Ilumatobacter sp.]|uniref:SET domain-containing protein-lysine N-methyltransferase n=1 Tax=Ilumatobacter sp. TaxID=1967498 RepID=UPI003B51E2BE
MPEGLKVEESPTGAGRGVFATRSFEEGEEIERCPMLVAEPDRGDALESGAEGYVFGWADGRTALALGYGSLYNHSYDPNATTLETGDELVITATREIRVGDEIYINYMGTATDGVWFDVLE